MRAPLTLIALAAPLALAGCGDPAPSYVDQAWVRLSPNKDTPSAGYFVAHGGDAGVQLRGVMTDYALKVEMHESVGKDGMMSMQPIESVDVPAKGTVAFAPGGKHLMIWGVNDTAISRGKMQLTFLMSNGDRLLVDAVIRKPDGSAPAAPAAGNATEEHTEEHKAH
ncbi:MULTISPECIES: copper chaperone PCu(A)C [Sphingobium]|jgi:copper(I)-binding protein|uniref:Copper chaperone PCu(A)C n=1 Tax=Sphingobium yanoikuyae TaxID=13690 RepID=A0A9X7UBQ9_SPHYA|nr:MULTISPECIES: copper chaperone PCu(A)C [Sphingobium]PZU66932.1 MAG: copper chaperone PCu(A)C [Sphingobium sp.]QNG47147.1 copper chaperone PCu(A)C [Sphingobium yanoikuyae]